MNLGFDAISHLPISQVGADNVVTITVTGNNLIINGFETVLSSFPNFLKLQRQIGAKYEIKKK